MAATPMIDGMLREFANETANTRRMLERVPFEKNDWKPHPKSFSLGRLAAHVAELTGWIAFAIETEELDWASSPYKSPSPESNAALLRFFDDNVSRSQAALEKVSHEELMKPWTMRAGDQVFFTMPKVAVIRTFSINHMVHHRGQLSVYLRLNDVPLPGLYGPTADEKM